MTSGALCLWFIEPEDRGLSLGWSLLILFVIKVCFTVSEVSSPRSWYTSAMARTIRLVVVLLGLVPLAARSGEAPGCRPPPASVTTRPNAAGPPVAVRVGLFVVELASIDEISESFTLDFLMVVRWHDPRLAAVGDFSLEGCLLRLGELWHPHIGIVNEQRLFARGDETLRVDRLGNVEFRAGYHGSLSAQLDLRRFPFDEQRLAIAVSTDYPPSEVELVGDTESTGLHVEAALAGWRVVRVDDAPLSRPIGAADATFGVTEFALRVQRASGYYAWKIFLPLTFIIGMASVVFWLDPRELGPQIGVSTASAFTLVSFLISLDRFLPRVSYLTTADLFVLGALALVFGALAACVVTGRLAKTGRLEAARRVDAVARWAYPAAYGVVTLLLLLR
jgi:hypothetical protein